MRIWVNFKFQEVMKMEEIEPELKKIEAVPVWYHNHGNKMKIRAIGIQKDFLVIQGSAAEVVITKVVEGYLVGWKIRHGGPEIGVLGKTWFSSDDLAMAFGLRNTIPKFGKWLIERFGGTTASQGAFIRYKDWLNIPGPGTGHDYDPNVSIQLTQEIKQAVRTLLE